jgi:hypothetical protein
MKIIRILLLVLIIDGFLFAESLPENPPILTKEIIKESWVVKEPNGAIAIIFDSMKDQSQFLKWVLKDKKIVRITSSSPNDNSNYTKWVYDDSLRLDKNDNNLIESFSKIDKDNKIFWENADNKDIKSQEINEDLIKLIENQIQENTP